MKSLSPFDRVYDQINELRERVRTVELAIRENDTTEQQTIDAFPGAKELASYITHLNAMKADSICATSKEPELELKAAAYALGISLGWRMLPTREQVLAYVAERDESLVGLDPASVDHAKMRLMELETAARVLSPRETEPQPGGGQV